MLTIVVAMVVTPLNAAAASGGCSGSGCNGLDPSNRCDSDAFTVASMAVTDGQFDLRYSPSCQANWGRYTPYFRDASFFASQGKTIYARVTAWNPGGPSYGTAHHDLGLYGSSWSQMVDGRWTACTGVEVVLVGHNGDYDSQGWGCRLVRYPHATLKKDLEHDKSTAPVDCRSGLTFDRFYNYHF